MSRQQRPALGIDLGGTAIKAGVVTPSGEIIGQGNQPTEVPLGVDGVVANMAKAARQALSAAGLAVADLDGLGVGAPGICDGPRGVVVDAVNLSWRDVPVTDLLSRELGIPAYLDNDANCAALGEQWCGAARGSDHVLLFTVGTGIGGGLILNGKIYHGYKGWAGEFGHMPIVDDGPACNCGRHGCLETVASTTAMVAAARRAIAAGRAPYMAGLAQAAAGGSGSAEAVAKAVDGRLILAAARAGDEPALAILRQAGEYLGLCVAGLVGALNPELVVVGGGVSAAGDLLLEPMRQVVANKAMPGPASAVRIVPALLGNDAGLIGAASLVWR